LNKRDFLKSTAALAVAPAVISRTKLASASVAERHTTRARRKNLGPVPSYVFDSERNSMTFYRYDVTSFSTRNYLVA